MTTGTSPLIASIGNSRLTVMWQTMNVPALPFSQSAGPAALKKLNATQDTAACSINTVPHTEHSFPPPLWLQFNYIQI